MRILEAGKAMYQERHDRLENIEKNIERIETHPQFLRQCEVLETIQAAFAAEHDEVTRADMWARFSSLFRMNVPYTESIAEIESKAISSVYHGTFDRHALAKDIANGNGGETGDTTLNTWNQVDEEPNENEWFGKALFADFTEEKVTNAAEGEKGTYDLAELHLKPSHVSNMLQYLSVIKADLNTLRDTLRQPDARKVDKVLMVSWVISPRLHRTLGTLFSQKVLNQIKLLEPDYDKIVTSLEVEDGIDYDKVGGIVGYAISNNPNAARDWVVNKKPPEIGYIECSLEDFLQEPAR